MIGYLNGREMKFSDPKIDLAAAIPIATGTLVHTARLEPKDEIWIPNLNLKLFVQSCEPKEDLYVATLTDRLGFIENGSLLYNKIYVPGTYYDTILNLLLPSLRIEYRSGLSAKTYQYLSLPVGYSKQLLLNAIVNDLIIRLIVDENNDRYVIDEISETPVEHWNGYAEYHVNLDRTINSYTVTNAMGMSVTAYAADDLSRYGLLQDDPVGTYLLYGGSEMENLARYKLQKIMGQRKKMTCIRNLTDIHDMPAMINSCWIVGSEKYRIESVSIVGSVAKFGGYKLEEIHVR